MVRNLEGVVSKGRRWERRVRKERVERVVKIRGRGKEGVHMLIFVQINHQ